MRLTRERRVPESEPGFKRSGFSCQRYRPTLDSISKFHFPGGANQKYQESSISC